MLAVAVLAILAIAGLIAMIDLVRNAGWSIMQAASIFALACVPMVAAAILA